MEWIAQNWGMLLIVFLLTVGLIDLIRGQKESAKNWLLRAVVEAEREFGGKTGQLKLRTVYEEFMKLYPTLRNFISFGEFSDWVDNALEKMHEMEHSNPTIYKYIHGLGDTCNTEEVKEE